VTKAGKSLIKGMEEAIAYAKGDEAQGRAWVLHVPERVNVKKIRRRLRLTQAAFAERYGFSLSAVRHWEQGRRYPEGAARTLLTIIDREPEAIERALAKR